MEKQRCPWAKGELDIQYHDQVWGKPVFDDRKLFEMIILEGMQAGLSWSTILKKRENMRAAFDDFDPYVIAQYDEEKKQTLLLDSGIIRNRAKINALVGNAQGFLKILQEKGSFSQYLWEFVDHQPIVSQWTEPSQVPAKSEISDRMSKALLAYGFKFVGATICYAFMQAVGMVNDHMVWCHQYDQCKGNNKA